MVYTHAAYNSHIVDNHILAAACIDMTFDIACRIYLARINMPFDCIAMHLVCVVACAFKFIDI